MGKELNKCAIDAHGFTGDIGLVIDTMALLEEMHDVAGWDNTPATLYHITRDEDSGNLLSPEAARLGIHNYSPQVDLAIAAHSIATVAPTDEVMRKFFLEAYEGTPYAHFVITEAWTISQPPGFSIEEFDRVHQGRHIADIPGANESREVMGIVENTAVSITRIRGSEPFIITCPVTATGSEPHFEGAFWDSLRDLHRGTINLYNSLLGESLNPHDTPPEV